MDHLILKKWALLDTIVHPVSSFLLLIGILVRQRGSVGFYPADTFFRIMIMLLFSIFTLLYSMRFVKAKNLTPYLIRRNVLFFVIIITYRIEAYHVQDKTDVILHNLDILVTTIDIILRLSVAELHETHYYERLRDENPSWVFTKEWTIAKVPLRLFPYLQTALFTWTFIRYIGATVYVFSLPDEQEMYYILSACRLSIAAVLFGFHILYIVGVVRKHVPSLLMFYWIYAIGSALFWLSIILLVPYKQKPNWRIRGLATILPQAWLQIGSSIICANTLRWITYFTLEKSLPLGKFAPYYQSVDADEFENEGIFQFASRQEKHVKSFLTQLKVSRKNLTIGNRVGNGHSGTVYKASLRRYFKKNVTVAVKVPKIDCNKNSFEVLLSELKIMHVIGRHPFLVCLYGVCDISGSCGIVSAFCANGDLLSYLRCLAPSTSSDVTGRMLCWVKEIAEAMNYLASRSIIHGDLAARNVLLDSNFHCKVSDFGMSLTLYNYQTYAKTNFKEVPFRWMAPESLKDLIFSVKSDVYSYGVVLWEVFSYGREPWEYELNPCDLLVMLDNGVMLPCPGTSNLIWYEALMKPCWNIKPKGRPTFDELLKQISKMEIDYVQDSHPKLEEV